MFIAAIIVTNLTLIYVYYRLDKRLDGIEHSLKREPQNQQKKK